MAHVAMEFPDVDMAAFFVRWFKERGGDAFAWAWKDECTRNADPFRRLSIEADGRTITITEIVRDEPQTGRAAREQRAHKVLGKQHAAQAQEPWTLHEELPNTDGSSD